MNGTSTIFVIYFLSIVISTCIVKCLSYGFFLTVTEDNFEVGRTTDVGISGTFGCKGKKKYTREVTTEQVIKFFKKKKPAIYGGQ